VKKTTQAGGIFFGIAAGVLAVLWLLRDRLGGPAPATVVDEVPGYPIAPPPPAPKAPREPDDLSVLKGIGPVYQTRLADAGVVRFDELAAAEATTVAAQIEAPVSRVQGWIDEARRLVR
jgi:predicted flap endonuclease-1-like 5' DNA nuclease